MVVNESVRVHLYTVTYGGCVSSFLRIQQSSAEPPYVAGISDDIASSLRGIIRSILIREDYLRPDLCSNGNPIYSHCRSRRVPLLFIYRRTLTTGLEIVERITNFSNPAARG